MIEDRENYSMKVISKPYESSYNDQTFRSKIDHCQRKIGTPTYITVFADIAFGVSRLSRFPSNHSPYFHYVADKVLKKYLALGLQLNVPRLQTIQSIDHMMKDSERDNMPITPISSAFT